MPARRRVQARADEAQQGLVALDLAHLEGRGHAAGGQLLPVAAQARALGHPQDHLQVAQAAGRLLAVGLQRIGRVLVLGVALAHLQRLGDQKRLGVHLRPVLPLELCKQRGIAAHQPRFEQRGLHGDIARALGQALSHRAHARSDLQARVPAAANEAFELGAQGAAGLGCRAVGQQQQDIDIGIGEQLVAPEAADRHQGHVIGQLGALPQGLQQVARQRRQLAQQHADAAR